VCQYKGELVSFQEGLKREDKYRKLKKDCFMYQFDWSGETMCIDATREYNSCGRLINHSKRYKNIKGEAVQPSGSDSPIVIFVAIRDIEVGEELLNNYDIKVKAVCENPWLRC